MNDDNTIDVEGKVVPLGTSEAPQEQEPQEPQEPYMYVAIYKGSDEPSEFFDPRGPYHDPAFPGVESGHGLMDLFKGARKSKYHTFEVGNSILDPREVVEFRWIPKEEQEPDEDDEDDDVVAVGPKDPLGAAQPRPRRSQKKGGFNHPQVPSVASGASPQ